MARTINYDPGSTEARSPLIAGLAEACNKLTGVLNMKTSSFTDTQMAEVYISETDRYRIYQIPLGNKLWLQTPAPVIKKNGVPITESNDGFTIDYIGGSIAFEDDYRLTETDVVTVSATYIIDSSGQIADILTELNNLEEVANQYKGYYPTADDLSAAVPEGQNGDYALIGADKSFYIWNSTLLKWESTQAISDLSDFYTSEQVDNLLKSKQDNIVAHGEATSDDDYYYGGRKTWQSLSAKVLGLVLTDLSLTANQKITAADTILSALGKLQAQIDNNIGGLSDVGAPTESTVGVLGQDYINSANGDKYHLVAIETQDDGSKKYIWEQYANKNEIKDIITVTNGAELILAALFGEGPYEIEFTKEESASLQYDDVPTENSPNLVNSGVVYTALQAKSNKPVAFRTILLADGWANNQQTLTDTRFTSSDDYGFFIGPISTDYDEYVGNNVRLLSMNNGSAIFKCDEVPTGNLTLDIQRLEVETGV